METVGVPEIEVVHDPDCVAATVPLTGWIALARFALVGVVMTLPVVALNQMLKDTDAGEVVESIP